MAAIQAEAGIKLLQLLVVALRRQGLHGRATQVVVHAKAAAAVPDKGCAMLLM